MGTLPETLSSTAERRPRSAATAAPTWWLPSLTEVVFAAVLLWILVGGQARALLADGDTGWHIRTGDYILAHRSVPRVDLFSFSRPGQEWFAWEWGSDVALALAHRWGGLKAVAVAGGVLIAATLALLFHYLLWQGANVLVAVIAMLLAGSASTVHWLARPHLFTWLLFLVTVWMLEADRRRPSRALWMLVPLTMLWCNLHGGFLLGPATLGLYWASSAAEAAAGAAPRDWSRPRRYGWVTLAAAAATLVNPYSYHLHQHIWRYLGSDFIRNRVEEFQSPRFRGESMLVFELLLVAGLLVAPRLWRRREFAAALLVVALAHAALGSVRHVLLYVLAATPLVARELSQMLASLRGPWGSAIAGLAAPGGAPNTRAVGVPVVGLAAVGLALAALDSGAPRWQVEFPRERFPHAALAQTEKKLVGRRVFTSDQWGDYLIYRYYPAARVFIDGRSDFYGPEIGQQYLDALGAAHGWERILDRYRIDAALLPAEWPLATLLKAHPGWQLDYDDGRALVLRRRPGGSGGSAN